MEGSQIFIGESSFSSCMTESRVEKFDDGGGRSRSPVETESGEASGDEDPLLSLSKERPVGVRGRVESGE